MRYRYVAKKNPQNVFIGGVPLADIDDELFESLTEPQKAAVADKPFYELACVDTELDISGQRETLQLPKTQKSKK